MHKLSKVLLLSLATLTMLLSYQNCGRAFQGLETSSRSSSCKAQRIVTPFEKQKVHISQAWFKGIRKASAMGNQLVVTVDVQCLEKGDIQQFMGHDLDLKEVPNGMKHYSYAFDFPGTMEEDRVWQAALSNDCILGVTEQMEVKRTQFRAAATTVTDPRVPEQEYLDYLRFDESVEMRNATNEKIIVAVIDTGVNYNHADLSTQMWNGPQGETGYNFIANNALPLDDDGHGTHVAGIIGAAANNNIGIAGIAANQVDLMAVKVLDNQGNGSVQGVYNGIAYAINNGAEIINLSIEAPGQSPLIETGVFEAINAGVVVTMAAGNANTQLDANNLYAPAYIGPLYSGAISVASVDSMNGARSSFSNYGSQYIEIAAPGSHDTASSLGILSTYGNDYLRVMGTSQATPMVSGAAALLMSYLKSKGVGYTPSSIENWIKGVGKTSVPNLTTIVHDGDVLNLDAMTSATLTQYPLNSGGGVAPLPGDDSAGNRTPPPSSCLGN